jgi:hypothetical protein
MGLRLLLHDVLQINPVPYTPSSRVRARTSACPEKAARRLPRSMFRRGGNPAPGMYPQEFVGPAYLIREGVFFIVLRDDNRNLILRRKGGTHE